MTDTYDISPLLQPLTEGSLHLKNRFVLPSMQRHWCVDGAPDERLMNYYSRRVLGGSALIMSESCAIDHPSATRNPTFARLDAGTAEAWQKCITAVHDVGGQFFMQLWHQGAVAFATEPARPGFVSLSPSGYSPARVASGTAATLEELAGINKAYVRAALTAREIGADGIELHSGHGYLLDQFLWPVTNLRRDIYGGDSIVERAAFLLEVVRSVRTAVGPDFPISVRISQWKAQDYDATVVSSPEELGQLVSALRDAGVDIFDVSTRRFWEPEWEGSDLGLAGWVKSFTDALVIGVGSVGLDIDVMASLTGHAAQSTGTNRITELVRRFERGDFDLIAVGRSQISDPDFLNKLATGRLAEVRPFRLEDRRADHDV